MDRSFHPQRGGRLDEWGRVVSYEDEARGDKGIVDLSWQVKFSVSGRDRVRFIHNLTTNDVKSLPPNGGCYVAFTSRQGKMVAVGVVRVRSQDLLITTEPELRQTLLSHLEKYIVADDVRLEDVTDRYALFGVLPMVAMMKSPGGETLRSFHWMGSDEQWVSPVPYTGGPACELLFPVADAEGRWNEICAGGASPMGWTTYADQIAEFGFPRWGVDMDETNLPVEVGLEDCAVSYTKGCYIGQEVIQRVKTYGEVARRLVRLRLEGDQVPQRGEKVLSQGREVGRITSAVFSERENRVVANALVSRAFKETGTKLAIQTHAGEQDCVVETATPA